MLNMYIDTTNQPTNQPDPCFTGLARQVVLRVLKLPARWFGQITMLEPGPSFVVVTIPMDPNTVSEGTANPLNHTPVPLPRKVRLDP